MRKKIIKHKKTSYNAQNEIIGGRIEKYELYEFDIENIKNTAYRVFGYERYDKTTSTWVKDDSYYINNEHKICMNNTSADIESTFQIGRVEIRDGYYDIYSLELVQDFTEVNPAV